MKKKTDKDVIYIRINSIDDIDFENLPEVAKKQLAKAYASLLGMPLKDAVTNNSSGEILAVQN